MKVVVLAAYPPVESKHCGHEQQKPLPPQTNAAQGYEHQGILAGVTACEDVFWDDARLNHQEQDEHQQAQYGEYASVDAHDARPVTGHPQHVARNEVAQEGIDRHQVHRPLALRDAVEHEDDYGCRQCKQVDGIGLAYP